ncbi:hypothetical protein B0H10DRAFT_1975606 [Mycena sp. CBHHK59/15]|nr:hypothetical protein B0H10DRAFT_1975606 [Mycena sp. CBHHK59/15]
MSPSSATRRVVDGRKKGEWSRRRLPNALEGACICHRSAWLTARAGRRSRPRMSAWRMPIREVLGRDPLFREGDGRERRCSRVGDAYMAERDTLRCGWAGAGPSTKMRWAAVCPLPSLPFYLPPLLPPGLAAPPTATTSLTLPPSPASPTVCPHLSSTYLASLSTRTDPVIGVSGGTVHSEVGRREAWLFGTRRLQGLNKLIASSGRSGRSVKRSSGILCAGLSTTTCEVQASSS